MLLLGSGGKNAARKKYHYNHLKEPFNIEL